MIKEYFANYFLHTSDVTFDMQNNQMEVHAAQCRALEGHAGRHRRRNHDRRPPEARRATTSEDEEAFCFTYGDGVSDVNITELIAFHKRARQAGDADRDAAAGPLRRARYSTARRSTASRKSRRAMAAGSTAASSCCRRKSSTTSTDDSTAWEREPLERLAAEGQLDAFFHRGFWQPMDTLRDKMHAGRTVAIGQGAMEGLADESRRSGKASAFS